MLDARVFSPLLEYNFCFAPGPVVGNFLDCP
jgi:hypothetical protein